MTGWEYEFLVILLIKGMTTLHKRFAGFYIALRRKQLYTYKIYKFLAFQKRST